MGGASSSMRLDASGMNDDSETAASCSVNQRNALKWEADEMLGLSATISAVLYANTNHPELKRDFSGMFIYISSSNLEPTPP